MPALTVLGLALAMVYGWQGLNALVAWDSPTQSGDVLDLGDGATVQPPAGWQLEAGLRVGEGSVSPTTVDVTLVNGGAVIEMRGSRFSGSAREFLAQVEKSADDADALTGARGSFRTDDGLIGATLSRSGPSGDVVDVAFKMATGVDAEKAPGLFVRLQTAPGQFELRRATYAAMLRSVAAGDRR